MKSKLGNPQRMVRVIIAAIIAVLYFTNVVGGTLGIVLLVIGSIMLLTSVINYCPIVMMNACPGDIVKKWVAKKEA
jgi:hypothetical protein